MEIDRNENKRLSSRSSGLVVILAFITHNDSRFVCLVCVWVRVMYVS